MVLLEQISALIDYLENHQDLALGHCSRTAEGRSLSKRYWVECAQILNSVSVDCPVKTPAGWRTFYNEYKSKLLKKIKSRKSEISATGGGPAKKIEITPLQERLYDILGRDVGEPLPGVRHNPLDPIITLPVVDASPTSTNLQLENNSFSVLENYEVPITFVAEEIVENTQREEIVENTQTEEISLEQENFEGRPSNNHQPPKRRRRQNPARRYAAEDRDRTALEAAQSRLDAIEAKTAKATLIHAQAINNLAASIDRMRSSTNKLVDLIGRVPKKKLRRIIISSDSETD